VRLDRPGARGRIDRARVRARDERAARPHGRQLSRRRAGRERCVARGDAARLAPLPAPAHRAPTRPRSARPWPCWRTSARPGHRRGRRRPVIMRVGRAAARGGAARRAGRDHAARQGRDRRDAPARRGRDESRTPAARWAAAASPTM
jgi:hypothetical protein